MADDVVQLLGLVAMFEARRPGWKPTDEEVDDYLKPDAPPR